MPLKSKLPRNKVPPPKLVKPTSESKSTEESQSEPQGTSGLPQAAEDQFELELCWCIQQLQAGLLDTKLQDKQVYNMSKSLNVLKNNSASLIKKRQVMRNTFGDYRSKMIDDEKKFGKSMSTVKFAVNKKLGEKSVFLKKAVVDKTQKGDCEPDIKPSSKAIINPDVSNEPFKFNFSHSENDE